MLKFELFIFKRIGKEFGDHFRGSRPTFHNWDGVGQTIIEILCRWLASKYFESVQLSAYALSVRDINGSNARLHHIKSLEVRSCCSAQSKTAILAFPSLHRLRISVSSEVFVWQTRVSMERVAVLAYFSCTQEPRAFFHSTGHRKLKRFRH